MYIYVYIYIMAECFAADALSCVVCIMQSLYCTHICICMYIHAYIINMLLRICFSCIMSCTHTHTRARTHTHTQITFLLLLVRHALLDTLLFTLFRCQTPSMFKAYTHVYNHYNIYTYIYMYVYIYIYMHYYV